MSEHRVYGTATLLVGIWTIGGIIADHYLEESAVKIDESFSGNLNPWAISQDICVVGLPVHGSNESADSSIPPFREIMHNSIPDAAVLPKEDEIAARLRGEILVRKPINSRG